MDTENYTQVKSLTDEIDKEIKKRIKYTRWDFNLAHMLIWVSIFASFGSSLIIASKSKIPPIYIAIVAGIPGLVVVVEKSFDFARRSGWDIMYKIELQELKNEIDFGKISPYKAARKFQEIIRRNEASFLKIGFFSRNNEKMIKDEGHSTGPFSQDSINKRGKKGQ
jgi:hypothetical protein